MLNKNSLCWVNSFLAMCLLSTSAIAVDSASSNTSNKESVDKLVIQTFTLDQAIDYAIANNPDLQIAIQRIEQADAQLGVALSAFYPQVSAKVGYETSNNPAQVFSMIVAQRDFHSNSIANINDPGYRQNFRPEIIGKVSLFRGGQDYQNSKAAELGIEAAEFERSSIHNALIQAVTATFYAHLAAIEAQKNAQNAIVAIESELKQTQLKYDAGTVLKSDVLSLEVKLAEAQESQIRATNGIETAKANLVNLLGLPSQAIFNMASSSINTPPKLTTPFNELLEQAMGQRPEVKAAAKQVEIAEHKVKSAQGAYLPKADAYVSYGQNSQTPGFSSSKENVTAGVAVEMDIFSGFNIQQQLRTAELKANEAVETERKTKLAVEQEVKIAYLKLQESLARLHVTDVSVQSADEALRLVKEERQAEVVTVTRYIEAEVARNTAQSNSIAAHYDALSAEAALKKAIGAWK